MTKTGNEIETGARSRMNGWRIAGWGGAAALLLLPAIAMQFTQEVAWTRADFLAAALMLAALGGGIELSVRKARDRAHKAGLIIASLSAFLTVWANGAVGIIGSEAEPINLAFYGMIVLAIMAGFAVKFRPRGMLAITAALVAGQLIVGLAAQFASRPDWGPVLFFCGLWAVAALCFRRSAAG